MPDHCQSIVENEIYMGRFNSAKVIQTLTEIGKITHLPYFPVASCPDGPLSV